MLRTTQALVVKLADQKPRQTETHSSTFPQDSDSESEIELRSTHTSPEITTSNDSDGTIIYSSTSPTPTQSLIGEGDLDPSEGQSQPLVGTLPLTEKDPPEKPKDKDPPPSSSAEGLDTEAHDKEDESTTPSAPGSSDKTEAIPTSPIRTRISTEYPPKDTKDSAPPSPQSKLKKGSEGHLPKTTKDTSLREPFSSFWSGKLGDVSDQSGRRHRWLIRKPKRRHSVELELLDGKDPRPYNYVQKGDRPLFPDKDLIAVI